MYSDLIKSANTTSKMFKTIDSFLLISFVCGRWSLNWDSTSSKTAETKAPAPLKCQ